MSFATSKTVPSGQKPFGDIGLQIRGIGVEYPEDRIDPSTLRNFAALFYPSTPALEKVLSINEKTGIDARASCIPPNHPVIYGADIPTVEQQGKLFIELGSRMASAAARTAIEEWGGDASEITHLVAASSTAFTNPGFEFFVAKDLGLRPDVERTLLHGVGCAGGLSALRAAANMACSAKFLGRPARVLVVCCEMGTLCVREELDAIHKTQEIRIPVTLFGDAASALVLSNGVGESSKALRMPIYDLLAWDHRFIPETAEDITFDVQADGWRPTLSHRIPLVTSTAVPPILRDLLARVPALSAGAEPHQPADFDWALHPGGGKIITDVQRILQLTPDHLRASYHVYKNYGNTSSATIFSVLNKLRHMGEGRDNVVACAFGPGVTVETCVLKRQRVVEEQSTASQAAGGWGCTVC